MTAMIAVHFDVSRILETWKFPLRVLEHLSGFHSVNTEAAELKRVSVSFLFPPWFVTIRAGLGGDVEI